MCSYNCPLNIFTMKILSFAASVLLLAHLFSSVRCRPWPTGSPELISGGLEGFPVRNQFSSSNPIRLKLGTECNEGCEQMYGFLPCSTSIAGNLFLILVYEYLLFHAESYVDSGGKRIFKILGPGVFGASGFQILGSLPEAFILLALGMWSSHENAKEYMITGVGLLAGSSIFLLTITWGTCVILGRQTFSTPPLLNLPTFNHLERLLFSLRPGRGVVTELATSYASGIMFASVIPLTVIQSVEIFHLSNSGERNLVLITLLISLLFLLCYFVYQLCHPRIQRRLLQYIVNEHLVVDLLKRVQDQTDESLLTENGSPNLPAIRRLFKDLDCDGDDVISMGELKVFLQEAQIRKAWWEKDKTSEEVMKMFDSDKDNKIAEPEFVNGMVKLLDQTKDAMSTRFHSVKSLKDLYQILKPWFDEKREQHETMRDLIQHVLRHLQNSVYDRLLAQNGTPNLPAIKRLFKDIDLDNDNYISNTELQELMNKMKLGMNVGEAASEIMKEFDTSGDNLLSEDEFVAGLSKWLHTTDNHNLNSEEREDQHNSQKSWEQIELVLKDNDKSPLAWVKAIALVAVGIVMLGVLAEPLLQSVRTLSAAANVPSFYVAFLLIPLATNARLAVSSIKEARRKEPHIISLKLSEIYGSVFMNNILGLVVLLSMVYFRNLSWEFSAEVLVVAIVSAIVGGFASITTVYPVWTSIFAYLLYPLSLVLVYVLGDFNWLS